MKYLGGKNKIAKEIIKVILENTNDRNRLIEPFCGSCAITCRLAPHFKEVIANDISRDVILLYQELQKGWIPPDNISEDEYQKLKNQNPSVLRGFVGFGCSFGGKFFGGYARGKNGDKERNYASEAKRALLRDVQTMNNVIFLNQDYRELEIREGDVVYCDPPYANTTGYKNGFDNDEFWRIMNQWSEKALVFVSEYNAPNDYKCIWEKRFNRNLKSKFTNAELVTEKLFMRK